MTGPIFRTSGDRVRLADPPDWWIEGIRARLRSADLAETIRISRVLLAVIIVLRDRLDDE